MGFRQQLNYMVHSTNSGCQCSSFIYFQKIPYVCRDIRSGPLKLNLVARQVSLVITHRLVVLHYVHIVFIIMEKYYVHEH